VTSTTDGNLFGYEYEPDDMPTRSIPVGELLRREGHASVARAFHRRRGVLVGVAAGSVLAIGAAVGSLLIGHSDGNANGLASGTSGSGAQVPNDGTGAISTTTGSSGGYQQHQATPNVAPMAQVTPQTQARLPHASHTHSGQATSGTTPAAPSTSTQSQTTAPSTGTTTAPTSPSTGSPSTGTTSTPPSTSTPPTTTTPPSSGNGGGLLGTVTGTLGSITQPVFNWFG
jgi:hypothetical protein